MFRILIGATLLVVGLSVLCASLADTHTALPTDLLAGSTWLFWGMFVLPMALGVWVLFGKRLRGRMH